MQLSPSQQVALMGSKGRISFDVPWSPYTDRPTRLIIDRSEQLEEPMVETVAFEPCNQYTLLAEGFSQAVTSGATAPLPLEDSVKNMAVLDALARSATERPLGSAGAGLNQRSASRAQPTRNITAAIVIQAPRAMAIRPSLPWNGASLAMTPIQVRVGLVVLDEALEDADAEQQAQASQQRRIGEPRQPEDRRGATAS